MSDDLTDAAIVVGSILKLVIAAWAAYC